MNLLIFGATGTVGRKVVEQELEKRHNVTAFTRSPSKLDPKPNLNIAQGEVLDFSQVKKTITNQDAVICTLGAGRKGTVRSEGTQNIIKAMQGAGIQRFICLSTLGVGTSRKNLNFFWKYIMFGLFLRKAFADHQKQEKYIKQSDLDWTIVRPAAFTDGKRTGEYKHGFSPTDHRIKLKISRADVADFILKQLNKDTYLRGTPGVSY